MPMMTRSIAFALLTSIICLLVIGGPIASALFESPRDATVTLGVAADSPPTLGAVPLFAYKVGWLILGAVMAAGIALTFSRRLRTA